MQLQRFLTSLLKHCPVNPVTNLRDPTWAMWNKVGSQLAVGTAKGNLLLFDKSTGQILPIVGKHQKRISSGAWNSENQLALSSRMSSGMHEGGEQHVSSDNPFIENDLARSVDRQNTTKLLSFLLRPES